ncbi:hypothetical protein ACA910_020928 [Epithemia clementina (nom. ined.)]
MKITSLGPAVLATIIWILSSPVRSDDHPVACHAACQIQGVHALWEEQGSTRNVAGNIKYAKDRPSFRRRIRRLSVDTSSSVNSTSSVGKDDLLMYFCRTLWDQTVPKLSSFPSHEVALNFDTIEKYGAQSLEDGDWTLCYDGGSLHGFIMRNELSEKISKAQITSSSYAVLPSNVELLSTKKAFDLCVTSIGCYNKNNTAFRQLITTMENPFHRSGGKTLLVVRINTLVGEEPSASKQSLKRAIFGPLRERALSMGRVSVVDQYSLISHGQLNLKPIPNVPGLESELDNGVMNVFFSAFNGENIQSVTYSLVQATERALGIAGTQQLHQFVDHTIFCLPDAANAPLFGNSEDWTAFTYRYEPYSFYRKNRCSRLSIVMHELGHAILGFRHSGAYKAITQSEEKKGRKGMDINGIPVREDEYADETGYMGYSVNLFGRPRKAMNAHKHWLSRWYSKNAMLRIDPLQSGPTLFELVGYTQYRASDWTESGAANQNKGVLAQIGNLYLQYNSVLNSTAFNVDTRFPNTVTVVKADSEDSVSFLVAILEPGGAHFDANYMDTGLAVIVGVCPAVGPSLAPPSSVVINVYTPKPGEAVPECPHVSNNKVKTNSPSLFNRPSPTIAPSQSPTMTAKQNGGVPSRLFDDENDNNNVNPSTSPLEGEDEEGFIFEVEEPPTPFEPTTFGTANSSSSTTGDRMSHGGKVALSVILTFLFVLGALLVAFLLFSFVLNRSGSRDVMMIGDEKNSVGGKETPEMDHESVDEKYSMASPRPPLSIPQSSPSVSSLSSSSSVSTTTSSLSSLSVSSPSDEGEEIAHVNNGDNDDIDDDHREQEQEQEQQQQQQQQFRDEGTLPNEQNSCRSSLNPTHFFQ